MTNGKIVQLQGSATHSRVERDGKRHHYAYFTATYEHRDVVGTYTTDKGRLWHIAQIVNEWQAEADGGWIKVHLTERYADGSVRIFYSPVQSPRTLRFMEVRDA